jgi:hypothetical protein
MKQKSMLLLMDLMYQVTYFKPKKKGYAYQQATFLKIDDAIFWEQLVKEQGAKDIKILVN